jgi:hypothetical protein
MGTDPTMLMITLLFGAIGAGMFMYGKNAQRPAPLIAGLSLMVVPYFIPNVIGLTIVCLLLTITPWFLRHA